MKSTKNLPNQKRKEFWKRHIEDYSSTNLTQRAYCKKVDISYWSFNSWKRRMEKENKISGFVEISTAVQKTANVDKKNSINSDNFEIILPNELRIKIPDNFDSDLFYQIITMVGEII